MGDRFGRFGGTATWVLVALQEGPLDLGRLFDRVRQLDGPVGPGTFFGAILRLERYRVIEAGDGAGRPRAYRLRAAPEGPSGRSEGGAATPDGAQPR